MSREHDLFALVPVKGSSERVPKKNLRPFADTSLTRLKLSQLKKVPNLKRIIVSSEEEEVLALAKEMGVETHVRDSKYSTPHIPMSDVYSFIASEVKGGHIAWVNVTNPLAGPEVYEKAIESYFSEVVSSEKYDGLISVYEVKDYLFYNGKPINFPARPWPRSQDLQGICNMSFVINMMRRDDMVRWGSCLGTKPYFYYLDKVTSVDVDFQEDFDFCEMMYQKRRGIQPNA